ncbi:MAG: zf-HC2 domain-containing protein [Abditibacteriales bacterium]|nr:zf-HC2 domain-containing protein [Abditibacteriales bacterium]MDW8368540.1 zf-HC2 domain-containing protein [Abditibacteriales bacterium]
MTCRHAQSLIQNYRDGELDANTAQALENHLSRCVACRREHEALQRLSHLVAASPVPEPPAGYWETVQFSVLRRIRAQESLSPLPRGSRRVLSWWRSLSFRPALAMGAVVVLAFVGGIFVGRVSARTMPMASPNLTASQPVSQPTSSRLVRDNTARPEKTRTVVQSLPPASQPATSKPKAKAAGKLMRVVRHASSLHRHKAHRQQRVSTSQPANLPTLQPLDGYVVYSLEPPPLTLSVSADSVSSSSSETNATDGSALGEVVAPVHQQIIVPLSVVNTHQSSGTPSGESSSSEEGKSAPII